MDLSFKAVDPAAAGSLVDVLTKRLDDAVSVPAVAGVLQILMGQVGPTGRVTAASLGPLLQEPSGALVKPTLASVGLVGLTLKSVGLIHELVELGLNLGGHAAFGPAILSVKSLSLRAKIGSLGAESFAHLSC
jgi:hypothetical protein